MRDEGDAELLARSLTEPGAFASIFDRHYAAVRVYLASRIHDRHIADELAAETFLHAYAARDSFRRRPGYDGVRAWIFRIASNLLNDELRAHTRRTSLIARMSRQRQPVAYQDPELGPDPELLAALERLRGAEREALLLFVWAELSYEEIAAVLGVRVGTVRSRIHRARTRLQRVLAAQPQPAEPPADLQGDLS
jgi:RNA polymerase sigma-70 factor (ECF subfamily)